MAIRFLLDTNILSEPTKRYPNDRVMQQLAENSGQFAIASISYHEVMVGYLRLSESQKRREIETYMQQSVDGVLEILPYDDTAARWHAIERTRLMQAGKTPPYVDGQIAAIAATNNLILVTRNTDDFQYFQDLQIANWFE
ncbi:putative nucleic acid-binding protein [Leptolyngbya sp. PCC 7375]|nr:putative nucleic acid-binding protein [Leptolyngbya sp. PCC 7375]